MCVLTAIATAVMINCIGKTNWAGKRRFSIKTVEKPIVIHNMVRAVILVLSVSPLPSL